MQIKKVSLVAIASTLAVSSVIFVTPIHAEDGPGRRLPILKNLDKVATKAGESFKRVENKFATRSEKLKEREASEGGRRDGKFATLSGALKQQRSKRLENATQNLVEKFTKITQRQENILNRANARIASLSAEGKNVSDLNAKSASISGMIAKQKTSITALQTTLQAIIASGSSDGEKGGNAVRDVARQIGATQKALQNLINAMGKLTPHKNKPSGSPSAQPTQSPQ